MYCSKYIVASILQFNITNYYMYPLSALPSTLAAYLGGWHEGRAPYLEPPPDVTQVLGHDGQPAALGVAGRSNNPLEREGEVLAHVQVMLILQFLGNC